MENKNPISHYITKIVFFLILLWFGRQAAFWIGASIKHPEPIGLYHIAFHALPAIGAIGILKYKKWGRWTFLVSFLYVSTIWGIGAASSFAVGYESGENSGATKEQLSNANPEIWMYAICLAFSYLILGILALLLFKSKAAQKYTSNQAAHTTPASAPR